MYEKLKLDIPNLNKEDRFSMEFRAINDAPNSATGVFTTTLVFGVYPKIPGAEHRGSFAERVEIICQFTKLAIEMKSKNLLHESMHRRNSPSVAQSDKVRMMPPGNKVIAEREDNGWTAYPLVRLFGNSVGVVLPRGKTVGSPSVLFDHTMRKMVTQ